MEHFHLTTPQQNIWNLQKYYEGTAIANLCGAIFFQEKRDGALLQEAICQFIRSQTGIRLRFHEGGEPRQYVSEEVNEDIPVRTFRSRKEFDAYAADGAKNPIGLSERSMYRFVVFHLEQESRSGILAVLSHLISDAWTFGLMANQMDATYRRLAGEKGQNESGVCLALSEGENDRVCLPEGDYVNFIHSENAYLASERYEKDKGYWEGKYTVHPEKSPVKLRSAAVNSVIAERITRTLPIFLEQGIRAYCRSHPVTEAVLFETAMIIYLFRINPDIETVTIGVPVLNRSNAREKEIAGMFVSTMPLTVAVTVDTEISELAGQITKEHMDLFRHQKYPYASILRQLREKQGFSGNLYDIMVSYQNAKTETGADTKWYSNGYSEVPLLVHIDNRDGKKSHTINVDYQTAVFRDGAEVELLIDRLEYILEQIVAETVEKVGDIGIVPKREYDRIVYGFNDTHVGYPREKCVHELFVEQAQRMPEKIALVFEDQKFTYRQLDEMSNSLAHFLREKGVRPNEVVPIIAKRSWHVIVAMLGILKAGGAYMPVDPNYPEERIKYMVKTVGAKQVLYDGFLDELPIECIPLDMFDFSYDATKIENINDSADSCYVLYTSGTTGTPKGVDISHQNLANFICNNERNVYQHYAVKTGSTMLACTVFSFDISIFEIFMSLLNGLCVVLVNEDEINSPSRIASIINKNSVDIMHCTPTKIQTFINNHDFEEAVRNIKVLMIGAEELTCDTYYKPDSVNHAS